MALGQGFKTGGTAPAKSQWGGIKSAQPRSPLLNNFGESYTVEMVSCAETYNPKEGTESYKITFKIVETTDRAFKVGDEAVVLFMKHGKARQVAMSKVKAMCTALAGFETDEEYDAADPEGTYISNSFTGEGENLLGEKAHVKVTQGSERKNEPGTYYAEYAWSPIEK